MPFHPLLAYTEDSTGWVNLQFLSGFPALVSTICVYVLLTGISAVAAMMVPISAGLSSSPSRASAATGGCDGDAVVLVGATELLPLLQPAIRTTTAAALANRESVCSPCHLDTSHHQSSESR